MKKFLFLLIMLIPINIHALDKISILYYKYIDNCDTDTCISNSLFNLQLNYLKSLNYSTITYDEFILWKNGKLNINTNSVLIIVENKNNSIDNIANIYNYKVNYINDNKIRYIAYGKPASKESSLDEIEVYLIKNNYNFKTFKNIINGIDINPKYDNDNSIFIPVLNYHFLDCDEAICLDSSKFEEQLRYLKNNNYKTLTMSEYINWKNGVINLPAKSVLITFDDGAAGTSKVNGNKLIPLLEKYDIHATLFLITSFWDISNYISPYLEIESHSDNLHERNYCQYKAKCLSKDEIYQDIKKSIDIINSNKAFAYPFYYFDNNIISAIKDLGFKVAFAGGNYSSSRDNNNFLIPRKVIMSDITLEEFISYLDEY